MAPRETENNAYAKFWGDKQRTLWYVMVFLEWSIKRVLFKVTTCLYLRPSSKARSLSTLIVVRVINDTEPNVTPAKYDVKYA